MRETFERAGVQRARARAMHYERCVPPAREYARECVYRVDPASRRKCIALRSRLAVSPFVGVMFV